MIKYFGEYATINTLEKELSEVESQISACYDFWNQESVPVDLIERSNTLEKELGFKFKARLCNTVGVVDSDFYYSDNEGHIFVKLSNEGDKEIEILRGNSFCQGIFMEYGITEDDKVETSRNGGFGSTDKNKKE